MDGDRKSRRGTLHERQFLTVGSSVGLRGCAASVCLVFALDLGKGTGLSRARGSGLGFESVWAKACGLRMGSGLTCLESVGDRDALSGLGGTGLRWVTFLSKSGLSLEPITHFMQLEVIPTRPELFIATRANTPGFSSNGSWSRNLLARFSGSLIVPLCR